ncbi:hypothetical protein [Fodinibius saliphilus]|uniref:hypothetical protein n=1 Tax=Fodinibius saliphilus TaxID=1920650 RepID=UPI001485F77C|nr:hypothetical protein [Fodinibius saliphilus]
MLAIVTIVGLGIYHINTIEEERQIAEMEAQKAQTVTEVLGRNIQDIQSSFH